MNILNFHLSLRISVFLFKGKIIGIKNSSSEIKVATMVKSGILDWKWPDREDVMWYEKEDIIKIIDPPISKNDRGIYSVPQMKGYSSIFYKL